MGMARIVGALALAGTLGAFSIAGAEAQQTQSRLYEVTKSKKLRVCQFPLYYSISFRNSKTGEIEGIDADLAKEFAKELDAKLEIVESSFGSFIADLQAELYDLVGADLRALGHEVRSVDGGAVGGYQGILFTRDPSMPTPTFGPEWATQDRPVNGVYRAGSDHRKDGQAAGW